MSTKFVIAIAVGAALAVSPAFAQKTPPEQGEQKPPAQEEAPQPKASKADVQKLVSSIKADKAKSAEFCNLMKLQDEYTTAAEKKDDKKLEALDKEMEEGANKIGPDFVRITQSDMDDASTALLDGLATGCKK